VVRPQRGKRVKGHAFRDVVVGGVVVDDCVSKRKCRQSCNGDHGGGGHHGVEDERQTVGHISVRSACQSRSVTYA